MTVETFDNTIDYPADGTKVDFDFNFKTTDAAHIFVYEDGILTTASVVVNLNADQTNSPGGSVNVTPAIAAPITVTVQRTVELDQTRAYPTGGDFPAKSHEGALDKLTKIAQQHDEALGRALSQSIGGDPTVDYTLPPYDAGKGWIWNKTTKSIDNSVNNIDDIVVDAAAAGSSAGTISGDAAGTIAGDAAGTISGDAAGTIAGDAAGTIAGDAAAAPHAAAALVSADNSAASAVLAKASEDQAGIYAGQAGAAAGIIVSYPSASRSAGDVYTVTLGIGGIPTPLFMYNIKVDALNDGTGASILSFDGATGYPIVFDSGGNNYVALLPGMLDPNVIHRFWYTGGANIILMNPARANNPNGTFVGSTTSVPTGTLTPVVFTVPHVDDFFNFLSSDLQTILVPPGIYKMQLAASVEYPFNVTGVRRLAIFQDNVEKAAISNQTETISGETTILQCISPILKVAPGDTFNCRAFHTAGVSLILNGAYKGNWFTAEAK